MKTQPKIKNTTIRKTSKRSSPCSPAVVIIHAKHPLLRHFRLVEHKHTGKLIRHRHSSHLTLVCLLLLVGIFMYVSAGFARVQAEQSGTVSIGVIVNGPAPTVGATITSPESGTSVTDQYSTKVLGTCAPGTFVVVQNNNQLVGSTVCTAAGIFTMNVQLQLGANVLSALNYDNLNQPGPITSLVNITVITTSSVMQLLQPRSLTLPVVLPSNPSIIPGITLGAPDCDTKDYQSLPTGGVHQVAIFCVPRFVQVSTQYTLGFLVWGGASPYAAEVYLGDGADDLLLSIANPGAKTIKFSYEKAGIYTITVNTTDRNGKKATTQTAVQVSGETKAPLAVLTGSILNTSWFKTPVPLYLIAVAITLGFWGGDIFDRNFGASKYRRPRKTA